VLSSGEEEAPGRKGCGSVLRKKKEAQELFALRLET